MPWSISYSETPSFGRSRSIYLRGPRKPGEAADLFVHEGGMGGADFDVPPPFWKECSKGPKPQPVPVAPELAERVASALRALSLPAMPSGVIGLDGVSYELEVFSGMNRALFHWWERLPEEWASLRPMIESLEELLAEVGSTSRGA